MKIKTIILQEMIAKAIKGASNNKMIPITSLLGIELKEGILTLMTTDGSNHLRVKEKVESNIMEGPTSFYTIINADTFSKLVAKTTSEYMDLTIADNYLSVKGNGTYKLEIPVNEDGDVIKFTTFDFNGKSLIELSCSELKDMISKSKVSVAQTMDVPCLTGYYLSDKLITTNRETMCCVNKAIVENPILISSEMAELIQLLDGEKVNLLLEDNKLLFETSKIVIYGKQLEGLDIYPVQSLEGLMNQSYDNVIKVNKQDLLNVLDRMNIFVTDYDKNGVYLSFTEKGLQITSQKSNASEIIDITRDESKEFVPFSCLIDILMLQSQVQVISEEFVEMHYGQETSIKLIDNNTTIIISLLNNEE